MEKVQEKSSKNGTPHEKFFFLHNLREKAIGHNGGVTDTKRLKETTGRERERGRERDSQKDANRKRGKKTHSQKARTRNELFGWDGF